MLGLQMAKSIDTASTSVDLVPVAEWVYVRGAKKSDGEAFLPSWESLWTTQCSLAFQLLAWPARLSSPPTNSEEKSLWAYLLYVQHAAEERRYREQTGNGWDLIETPVWKRGEELALPDPPQALPQYLREGGR